MIEERLLVVLRKGVYVGFAKCQDFACHFPSPIKIVEWVDRLQGIPSYPFNLGRAVMDHRLFVSTKESWHLFDAEFLKMSRVFKVSRGGAELAEVCRKVSASSATLRLGDSGTR